MWTLSRCTQLSTFLQTTDRVFFVHTRDVYCCKVTHEGLSQKGSRTLLLLHRNRGNLQKRKGRNAGSISTRCRKPTRRSENVEASTGPCSHAGRSRIPRIQVGASAARSHSQGPRHDHTPLQRVSASTVPAAARAQWLRLAASRCLLTTDPRISTFHPLPFSTFPPHPCTHTLTHMRWGLRSSTLVSTSTCLPRASPLRVSSTLPPRPWSRCRRTPRCSLLSVSGWRRTPRRPTARARRRPTAVPSSSSLPTRVARPSIGY